MSAEWRRRAANPRGGRPPVPPPPSSASNGGPLRPAPSAGGGGGGGGGAEQGRRDIQSLLRLVRQHGRQHDAQTVESARCRPMFTKMRKLLPKLLRTIVAAPDAQAVEMLMEMCELLELLVHARACPHAPSAFEEGEVNSGTPTTANLEGTPSSFPTIATMLFYLVSFYANARFVDAQDKVKRVVVELVMLLQRHDLYGFLHFFSDTVELVEDCILLEEVLEQRHPDASNDAGAISCYLNTAIHAYHGVDGALGATSNLHLCGCVPVDDPGLVWERKEQLKKLLPTIHVDSFHCVVTLRKSTEALIIELLGRNTFQLSSCEAFSRLCNLVRPIVSKDIELLRSSRVPTGDFSISGKEVSDVVVATLNLLLGLLVSTQASDHQVFKVVDGILELSPYLVHDEALERLAILILSKTMCVCEALSPFTRDRLRLAAFRWIQRVVDVHRLLQFESPLLKSEFVNAVITFLSGFTHDASGVLISSIVDVICVLDISRLLQPAQDTIVMALHKYLASSTRLRQFLSHNVQGFLSQPNLDADNQHTSTDMPRFKRRKKLSGQCHNDSRNVYTRHTAKGAAEDLGGWIRYMLFGAETSGENNLSCSLLALRVLLPLRSTIDKVAKAECQVLFRMLHQQIEVLLGTWSNQDFQSASSVRACFQLLGVVLVYLQDHEVIRIRSRFDQMYSRLEHYLSQQPMPLASCCIQLQDVDFDMVLASCVTAADNARGDHSDYLSHWKTRDYVCRIISCLDVSECPSFIQSLVALRAGAMRLEATEWQQQGPGITFLRGCCDTADEHLRSICAWMFPAIFYSMAEGIDRRNRRTALTAAIDALLRLIPDHSSDKLLATIVKTLHTSLNCVVNKVPHGSSEVKHHQSTETSDGDTMLRLDDLNLVFRRLLPEKSSIAIRQELLSLSSFALRSCAFDKGSETATSIIAHIASEMIDGDGSIRRTAIRGLRLLMTNELVFNGLLWPSEGKGAMEILNESIETAIQAEKCNHLESCIELVGLLSCSNHVSTSDNSGVLVWGVLQLLFIWVYAHGNRQDVSSAVFDQIGRVLAFHQTSLRKLFLEFPEEMYFPIVDGLLRSGRVNYFVEAFMASRLTPSAFLHASAAYVLPRYVVLRDDTMIMNFVRVYNEENTEDVDMDEDGSEGIPIRRTTVTSLLLNNIEYVLKDLIIHQVEAESNENRIKGWEFLFGFLPENSTIRDVMSHSPLRLLNLLAWELGGEQSTMAKKAFREISQYLNQDQDENSGHSESSLLLPRHFFLALMTELGSKISVKSTNHTRAVRAIKSINRLFGVFRHSVAGTSTGALDPFVPKVMAILKIGLLERNLQECAIQAWDTFIRMLTPKALDSNFVSIVVSVLPCISGARSHLATYSSKGSMWCLEQLAIGISIGNTMTDEDQVRKPRLLAIHLLRYLFIERRNELKQAFPKVVLLPESTDLDDIHAVLLAEVGDPRTKDITDVLRDMLPFINHWDMSVREIILGQLHHTLVTRSKDLQILMNAASDAHVDPTVLDVLFAVLNVAKTDTSESIRLACSKCLGALGAVDGARIPLTMLSSAFSSVSSRSKQDSKFEYSTKDLACVLIESWLVKELRAAPDNADAVAFAIQELLKFLAELTADPQHSGQNVDGVLSTSGRRGRNNDAPMVEWMKRRFERNNVLQFVEPYWSTNYTIKNPKKRGLTGSDKKDTRGLLPGVDDTTHYEKFQLSYEGWLNSWCRRLIHLSQPPERKIFWACRELLLSSPQIARFLLPYMIQNVLRSGRSDVYEEVKKEVMAVLTDDGVMDDVAAGGSTGSSDDATERAFGEYSSRHHQCAQTIFTTLDELNEWVWNSEKKRLALSGAASRGATPTPTRPSDVPSELDDQEKENLEEFLKDIPSQVLSSAAYGIKAYARALQYFEVYLRQQNPPSSNSETGSSIISIPVELNVVSKHASYLQQLYSSADEPDALTGLATLRRLYDAYKHSDCTSDRAAENDEAASSLAYLLHQIVDYEQLAQWEDALACYEQAIQEVQTAQATRSFYSAGLTDGLPPSRNGYINPGARGSDPRWAKPDLYSGIVRCLIQLGRLESALQHINGIVTQEPEFVGTLYPHALECAWRLSRWDLVADLLHTERQNSVLSNSLTQGGISSRFRNLEVSQLTLVRVLNSFHDGDHVSLMRNLHDARLEIMGPLAAACAESYQRAYPLLHKLHFLHEAEQGYLTLAQSRDLEPDERYQRWQLQCPWESRYNILSAQLKFRDPILALRRVMLEEADLQSEVSHNWLQYAKMARKEGYIRTANSALMHAEALDNQYALLEKAKLMVAQDRMYEALQILEPVDIDATKLDFNVEDPHFCAKNLLLATNWMQESGQRQGKKVVERYEAVIKFDSKWEKGYFFLAKYYEYLLSVSHPDTHSSSSSSSAPRTDDGTITVDGIFHSHLINLMKNYVLALSFGTKHVFQSMPRLLTLWFEYGELLQSGVVKVSKVNKAMRSIESDLSQTNPEQQILSDINQVVTNAMDVLPAYEWLVCFPQVTSRICHPNPIVVEGVKKIMMKVLLTYPTQSMWPLLGLSRSLNSQRRNRARDIIAGTQRQFVSIGQQEIANSFAEGMRLAEELISLAGHDPGNQRKIHIRLSRVRTKILIPVQAGLSTILPASGLAPADSHHTAFSLHSQIHIKSFSDKADVMMTKEKPKRIEMTGTDGLVYPFLCKREKTGDLRKDARMMEFNTMINKLLQKDREGRKRKLRLRTYAVVCLNEESGLMEWVQNTRAMRQLIGQIHKTERGFIQPVRLTHEIKERFLGMQKKYADNVMMMALYYRRKILTLPVFTPRFHQWFYNNFADPTAWFEARLMFSRSAAVWSMVGHIIGLGDRHGENILIDCKNGECVHVDFDCLFDKGLKLAKPEIVPFRLTPNMIDAFGITGYEGVFRRVSEVTMELLRGNKETLRSVLESFIHDPLVEWGRRGKNVQGSGAGGRNITEIPSDRSKEETRVILRTIDDRLRGIYNLGDAIRPLVSSSHRSLLPENETLPLSVQGQVDKLIHEATSHENLAQMYIGWMPFL